MLKQAHFFKSEPIDFSLTLNLDISYKWTGLESMESPFNSSTKNSMASHTVGIPVFVKRKRSIHPYLVDSCTSGFIENNTCYYAYALRSVCLKVKQTGMSTLSLDDQYGGYGCSPGDPQLMDGADAWPGAKYRFVQLGLNETNITEHSVDFTNLEVSIRSGQDPYIYANNITNGTLNFILFEGGRTPYISLTRGFVGFGASGLGVLFFLPSMLCCFVFCCRAKTRHFLIDNMREEHHMLLKLTTEKHNAAQNWSEYLFPSSTYGKR
jgi:hypothetical protein